MKKEYGLVLAGGGTKGAYEVGAIKALKELDINITAVVGTSIGAINGALMVQGDFDNIQDIYDNININNIIELSQKVNTNKNIFNIENIIKVVKDYTKKKGFTNAPLRKMMEEKLDIKKIYDSDIDFGMVTYSLKSSKALEIFKKDIPINEFKDYLLASACFPIYKAQKIGEEEYYDGGIYDNIPINMLIQKGYKNIIVIDISSKGLKRKLVNKNVYIKMIKSTENLGGMFNFNKELMNKNIQLGYLDTLKAFNKLQGHIYYFSNKEFNKMLNMFNLQTIYGIEYAANIYHMEKYKIYGNYNEFLDELLKKHKVAMKEYNRLRKNLDFLKIVKEYRELRKIINKGLGLCLVMDMLANKPTFRNIKIIRRLFSSYISAALAISELENYREYEE